MIPLQHGGLTWIEMGTDGYGGVAVIPESPSWVIAAVVDWWCGSLQGMARGFLRRLVRLWRDDEAEDERESELGKVGLGPAGGKNFGALVRAGTSCGHFLTGVVCLWRVGESSSSGGRPLNRGKYSGPPHLGGDDNQGTDRPWGAPEAGQRHHQILAEDCRACQMPLRWLAISLLGSPLNYCKFG